ncbi:hypothetical protein ACFYY8_13245 [Streptosporangium sp. NPDC001559]|uniref:hypothetical protein n=1 Tax=Streptosporangium sp. NPDC001559 TaxID=3366187 RepID=UPI0036EB6DCD
MPEHGNWTMHHFSQAGDNVPGLLRKVAESIEELGEVEVHDLILHTEIGCEDGNEYSVTVYFGYPA